jgi:hypothetical protein
MLLSVKAARIEQKTAWFSSSCGGLVKGLSGADFFKYRPMPRNRELTRVFRDMELVEQIGSGMSRFLKAYDRSIFELTQSFTMGR